MVSLPGDDKKGKTAQSTTKRALPDADKRGASSSGYDKKDEFMVDTAGRLLYHRTQMPTIWTQNQT